MLASGQMGLILDKWTFAIWLFLFRLEDQIKVILRLIDGRRAVSLNWDGGLAGWNYRRFWKRSVYSQLVRLGFTIFYGRNVSLVSFRPPDTGEGVHCCSRTEDWRRYLIVILYNAQFGCENGEAGRTATVCIDLQEATVRAAVAIK